MTVLDDIQHAALSLGGHATILSKEDSVVVMRRLAALYVDPSRPPRQLWERLRGAVGRFDPDGWRHLSQWCGPASVFLVAEGFPDRVVHLSSGALLTPVLSECHAFTFYVFDVAMSYLVAFNDHEYLITAGAAAGWVAGESPPMAPGEALAELISEISEEACCAGWAVGIEFEIWDCIRSGERQLAQVTLTDERVALLESLGEQVGGWIVYPWELTPTIVPRAYWEAVFSRWNAGERLDELLASIAADLTAGSSTT